MLHTPTTGPNQVTPLAADFAAQGVPLVWAAGGDGTVGAVAEGLAHSQTVLGVLPIGTANIWANELGVGQWLTSQAAVNNCINAQLTGTVQAVDLGECNSRCFLLWAGVGLDAHIIRQIEPRPAIGKRLGQLYYLISALWAGRDFKGVGMAIRTEEGEQQATKMLTIVANVRHYAGNDSILDTATRADDGWFEVWSMNGRDYREGLQHLIQFKLGRHVGRRGIQRLRGREISITVERPMPLQFDGEYYGEVQHVHIRLLPGVLRVLVPRLPTIQLFQSLQAYSPNRKFA